MKAFCFTLTILCVVQSTLAYPRPDFGINGVVSGSALVKSTSNELSAAATATGSASFTPNSGYTKLSTVSNALQAIGDAVVDAGTAVASALNTLSTDTGGPTSTVFGAVNTKIDAFTGLLNGPFSGNLATLTSNTGADIPKQFQDSFTATKTSLSALKSTLATLKTNIDAAKTAAGGSSSVSAAIIRAKVPAKSVNDVVTAIRNLKTNMPLIQYVIESSLDNLRLIDSFVKDINTEVTGTVTGRYKISYEGFQLNLGTEASTINSKLTAGVGSPVSSIISSIKADLDANAKYTSDLATPIGNLANSILNTVSAKTTVITTAFTIYSTAVANVFADLASTLGSSICGAIKSVSEAQIANGGFSDFCFSKFSPRVFAQVALTIDAFDVCYEKEVNRLISFESSVQNVAVQISYNTADLLDNLSACLALPTTDTKGACFTMLGPYYTAVGTKVDSLLTSVSNLVAAEATASYNRLGACLNTAIASTALVSAGIKTDTTACMTSGPVAPAPSV
ncbi:uncharacterized protein LOC128711182 [Anopheles marshallii]|uniref:uncharacterized protein LOC128711182 n=1 Tax=Anopheles marshallii TaxID=1521116 RepID=UPI00237ABC35|nr:uncharacterized protein LOC128711182 [Anopheles marshallii]